jgi:hypothetical protein
MSSAGTAQLSLRNSDFCGEGEPDHYGAPPDKSGGPRRRSAARRVRHGRNAVQPHENLGRTSVAWLSGAGAMSAVGPSIRFRPGFSLPRRAVDTPQLFTYRGARWSCIGSMEAAQPRGQVGRQRADVNLGGTAVA